MGLYWQGVRNMSEKQECDCGKCCFIQYYQDTDDEGRAISPPETFCEKDHKLYPVKCNDFKNCWR